MATGTEYKNLWERYKQECTGGKISIVRYCQMNGIVYSNFEKWYRRTYNNGVIPVEVIGGEPDSTGQREVEPTSAPIRIKRFEIVFGSGLVVSHTNLDYTGLKHLITKLEALC